MGTKEVVNEEDQTKLFEDSKTAIKTESFYMKRSLDEGNLMEALKRASNMIGELRTSLLSPKNYYALYIEASDQLRFLESYLSDNKHGKRISELYELVQYAGNILPRLYLLVTVGSVYIKLKEAPAKDVLRDLVEMCRGVQHPTKGLFLRTYLTEMTKDKVPDNGNEYEGRGGTARDSIDFILTNFTEMNKLWVRMQHQGNVRDREKREAERSELRILVGKNIARLAQLDGVDLETYSKSVLPKLVEQIVNCRDIIAQQYLMECIIQAFPDDFHLRTLETILKTCGELQGGVNIKSILVGLIDRLANFASSNTIPEDIKIFTIFSTQVGNVVQQQKTMPVEDILALEASLLNLAITCYPQQLEYVDEVFLFCSKILDDRKEDYSKTSTVKQILRLLQTPLDTYKNIITVLQLENYPKLFTFLSYDNRKRVALEIVKNAVDNSSFLSSANQVNKLLEIVQPLVKDEPDQPQLEEEDIYEEQNHVASLVHLFQNDNVEELFAMYITARKHFGLGGPLRVKHTLIPLVFRVLKLAVVLKNSEDDEWTGKAKKIFKFIHETITALSKTSLPEISLRLFLQAAQGSNICGSEFETITYEFITQSFLIYEEQISDSQAQFNALQLIIGTLQGIDSFGEENYDTLITKSALYSSKLLKKPDQCRAIYMCSHLFWSPARDYKNGKRVLECLQKSLKIADACMDCLLYTSPSPRDA
eukprot:TRINITY_DN5141_c0_g1_i5.p1 TRINITY_DN5141_c0_g1~~TRINITY_DN5141_c0_g1_i5.p1  ORF type:complete len:732 (+),score=221.45 TRINITY_DN5141_c0_g1_i5:76-2196(+)